MFKDERNNTDNESSDDEAGFTINKKYAKRFVEKNRRDDFFRAKEKGIMVGESSDSEEEDEVGDALTPQLDLDIIKTISMIRKKDSRIYKPDFNAFQEDDKPDDQEDEKKKKEKPVRYKDMVRKEALKRAEKDSVSGDESSEEDEPVKGTYVESQKQLKKAFQAAVSDEEDEEDNILTLKKKTAEETKRENEEFKHYLKELEEEDKKVATRNSKQDIDLMESMFREPPKDENETFLRKFILNRGWVNKDGQDNFEDGEEEDDFDAVEEADEYEAKYNFRFEEPGAGDIVAHPRKDETSVRRKENARKRQRLEKKKRKEEEKRARLEELRRLKNMKREELVSRIEKTVKAAGIRDTTHVAFRPEDLEKDFDPDEWDKKMNQTFNEDYYEEDDGEFDEEMLKKVKEINQEDDGELDDDDEGGEGNIVEHNEEEEEEEEVIESKTKKRSRKKRKRNGILVQNGEEDGEEGDVLLGDKELNELYKLDYEDVIGGNIKTRFRYRQVKPDSYGLSTEEILLADARTLNSFVSLKQFAPYKDDEFVANTKRRRKFRQTLKEKFSHRFHPQNDGEGESDEATTAKQEDKETSAEQKVDETAKATNEKRKRKRKRKEKAAADEEAQPEKEERQEQEKAKSEDTGETKKKKRKRKKKSKQ